MKSSPEMKEWEPLVDVLRDEVQEYGGLYQLLERQQREIFQREPDAVLQTNQDIEVYMKNMGECRRRREEMVKGFAGELACDPELSLLKMLPSFPEFIRPLLQALAEEINHMVTKTRRKARQNFLLLSRTMELTQETIRSMRPDNYTKTYSKKGRVGVSQQLPSRYKTFV